MLIKFIVKNLRKNKLMNREHINNYYTVFCAGGLLVALPVTVLFMMLQRYYVEGITGGAVKG